MNTKFIYFLFYFRRNNPVVIGQDNSNVPNVIKLFADAFARSSIEADSPVGQRMILILKHVQVKSLFVFPLEFIQLMCCFFLAQTNPAIFQTCMNILTNDERQALATAMNTTPTAAVASQEGSTNHFMNHHASV